jgi:hypothetical protein
MIEQLREFWKASPFVPFVLRLADGRHLHVPHSDFFWMTPRGGTIIVHDEQDRSHLVNPIMLVSVDREEPALPIEVGAANRP